MLRETVGNTGPMFPGATSKIGRGADVNGSIWPIGHNVNPAAFHLRSLAAGSFQLQRPQTTETAMAGEKGVGGRVEPGHGVDQVCGER
jgi:hypothetical protein